MMMPKVGGGAPKDNRNALLSQIQKGAKLKKTVTVDKSGPLIPGKTSTVVSPTQSSSPSRSMGSANNSSQNASSPGSRFGGGGPALNFQDELASRLRKTNISTTNSNSNNNRNEERPQEVRNNSIFIKSNFKI
jgi:WAS/WASL-interacting protein